MIEFNIYFLCYSSYLNFTIISVIYYNIMLRSISSIRILRMYFIAKNISVPN